ncbi:MAG TPA: hypothetical protein VN958_21925, partial [Chitinophagaceae bacterium]|nr:hypothetical protein [Chitinophagaceae bacterium]
IAEENQSSPAGNIKLNWEAFLFIDNHVEYLGNRFPFLSVKIIPPDLSHYNHSFASNIFHPPLI